MAFNIQTFKTRALTAIIFVAVMLCGLLYDKWSFFALFTIVHFGCWLEYQKIVGEIDEQYHEIKPVHKYGIILLGLGFMMFMTNKGYVVGNMELKGIGWVVMLVFAILLLAMEIVFKKKISVPNIAFSLLGLIYISLSWGLMMDLYNTHLGKLTNAINEKAWLLPVLLIAAIWINDTMAYIVGSFIGKTPFSKISPKKTWEGTAGGAILCVAVILLLSKCLHLEMRTIDVVVIALIAAIIGTAGDLLESKLKRMAGVKDSGSIMPGHGGFLDRFDSLLLATPFVWVYVKLIL
jgi:phosphatidate cytidylyltransferase